VNLEKVLATAINLLAFSEIKSTFNCFSHSKACTAMKTMLGKITTWFRSSGEPNLQKTYILLTEMRKQWCLSQIEMKQRIVRETVSLVIVTTV